MNGPETEILLKKALKAATEGTEEIEEWLEREGLNTDTVGQFLFFMSKDYPNALDAMTQIGKGFHIGWEARKLMEARD